MGWKFSEGTRPEDEFWFAPGHQMDAEKKHSLESSTGELVKFRSHDVRLSFFEVF